MVRIQARKRAEGPERSKYMDNVQIEWAWVRPASVCSRVVETEACLEG